MDKLKAIKILVFIFTFLLIFGTLCAFGLIYRKLQTPQVTTDISLSQPSGSYISDYKISDGNIYLLIKGGNNPDRIVMVNPQADNKIAEITIK